MFFNMPKRQHNKRLKRSNDPYYIGSATIFYAKYEGVSVCKYVSKYVSVLRIYNADRLCILVLILINSFDLHYFLKRKQI